MKKILNYVPYCGSNPYIFLSFSDSDSDEASAIMDRLQQRGCRFSYCTGYSRNASEEEERSRIMNNAGLVIALVSEAFKNDPYIKGNILYLQAIGKPVILIKRDSNITALSLGLKEDTPIIDAYDGINDDVEEAIVHSDGFSHAFLGEQMKTDNKISMYKLSVAVAAISVAVIIFAAIYINVGFSSAEKIDPSSVTELTLTEIPTDRSELNQYPNLEKIRIPQSQATEAKELLNQYTIVIYKE